MPPTERRRQVMGRFTKDELTWTEVLTAVRSLGWLGVRTPNASAMTAFYRDVLELEVILERPGATWFRLVALAFPGPSAAELAQLPAPVPLVIGRSRPGLRPPRLYCVRRASHPLVGM
jgi:hypothetical protein